MTIASLNWREYFTDKHLQKLIDAAVKNNPDLQMALQRIEVSRSSVKLANGALLPQVSLNVGGVFDDLVCTRWMAQVMPQLKLHQVKLCQRIYLIYI